MNTLRSAVCMHSCQSMCVPWYLPRFAPKPPCATQHLFIFRFKQKPRAQSGNKVVLSATMPGISSFSPPLALFTGFRLPSCSSGSRSKISAGSGARLHFSLTGLWWCQQRNRVNLTSSESRNKLMYKLQERRVGWLLMMNILTLNESALLILCNSPSDFIFSTHVC